MTDAFSSPLREVLHAGCPVVCCETHEEARLDTAVAAIAAELGVPVRRWSLLDAAAGTPPVDAVAAELAELRRGTGPLILLLADVHPFLAEPSVARAIRAFVGQAPKGRRLILVSPLFHVPAELEHDVVVLSLPLPSPAELSAAATEALGGLGLAASPETIAALGDALRGLTVSEARWVVRKAVRAADGALPDPPTVLREKGWRFAQVEAMEMVAEEIPLARVGGLDELKRWLGERREAFSRRARDFGLPPPRGLLLMGVQGCGKSLAAKAIAGFWGVPIVRLDMGLIIGHAYPEAVLRRAIRVAEAMAPVVLWVDELEKGFAAENAGASRRILGSLVTWLQEKREPVFVVATANEVEHPHRRARPRARPLRPGDPRPQDRPLLGQRGRAGRAVRALRRLLRGPRAGERRPARRRRRDRPAGHHLRGSDQGAARVGPHPRPTRHPRPPQARRVWEQLVPSARSADPGPGR
jgi:hypothetical protein